VNKNRRIFLSLILLSVIGCSKNSPDLPERPEADGLPEEAVAEVTSVKNASTKAVEVTARVVLEPGQSISGVIDTPKRGELRGVGVKIGNYKNRSDGSLSIEICQLEHCSGATSSLVGSKNNRHLDFELSEAVGITTEESVSWTLTRESGSNPVAVWIYPQRKNATPITLPDGTQEELAPKISLRYAGEMLDEEQR
jgi:hypothetical protein